MRNNRVLALLSMIGIVGSSVSMPSWRRVEKLIAGRPAPRSNAMPRGEYLAGRVFKDSENGDPKGQKRGIAILRARYQNPALHILKRNVAKFHLECAFGLLGPPDVVSTT